MFLVTLDLQVEVLVHHVVLEDRFSKFPVRQRRSKGCRILVRVIDEDLSG